MPSYVVIDYDPMDATARVFDEEDVTVHRSHAEARVLAKQNAQIYGRDYYVCERRAVERYGGKKMPP